MQAAVLQFGFKKAKFRSGSGQLLKQSFNHVNICLQNLQVIYANAANKQQLQRDDENNEKKRRKAKVKGEGRNILKKAKREKHHSRNK